MLGALTHDHFHLKSPLISEDTKATLDALFAMGSEVRPGPNSVKIFCDEFRAAPGVIDARNSGTTIRLMTGVASLLPSSTTLTGDESLVRRPMGPLVEALEQLGARCAYLGKTGTPPLTVRGPISGARAEMPGGVSSQFVSSLLIASTQKKNKTEIAVQGELRSRPYVDITLQMLKEFGAEVEDDEDTFKIPGGQVLRKDSYEVPGDYSSAAFPLAAAAVTGGDVTVKHLPGHSPQGDKAILDYLRAFGAKAITSDDSVRVAGSHLSGTEIDVRHTPDLFPILAVIGSVAEGKTVLSGGENLKHKESDRIATTTSFLQTMGARIRPKLDGCEIVGVDRLQGGVVHTNGDHRVLMAASVAALVSSTETRIEDDQSYKVSYPGFLRDMHQLGCRLEVRR